MDNAQNQSAGAMEELRKKFPRAGLKWDAEEDERLKKLYQDFRSVSGGVFDGFLADLPGQFGRQVGGIKARLAKYFTDIPGWDYEFQEKRQRERAEMVQKHFDESKDRLLLAEYHKYLAAKQETYIAFLRRVSEILPGVAGNIVTQRLTNFAGEVVKYRREDLPGNFSPSREGKESREIPRMDFNENPQAKQALRIMEETNENLFLTGEAGTGKSTLLQYFRYTTEKNVVVLAPTGVAALNVDGQTIHSFCVFGPDITLSKVKKLAPWAPKFKLLQKLQTIVIDEISMVRADLLDCVDKFLRLNGPVVGEPFGGIQMVFIGDLHQLPPVEKDFLPGDGLIKEYQSPYFFDSQAFRKTKFAHIRLRTMYRQKDRVFIDLLNAVRNNAVSQDHLSVLNERAQTADTQFTFEKFAIYLTTTNQRARQVNNFFLEKLRNELKIYTGTARGNFEGRELPTDLSLQIKVGAQVMMLNNDRRKRWVNGTMGKIVGIGKDSDAHDNSHYYDSSDADETAGPDDTIDLNDIDYNPGTSDVVIVELETGEKVYVSPHTWEMYQFVLDRDTQKIDSKITGTFTQYPFKLAWAVTIHKSQGKTFDKVYIDLSTGTFAHGQLYVALSRCRTLEGLVLKRPIVPQDILLDGRVVNFLNNLPVSG